MELSAFFKKLMLSFIDDYRKFLVKTAGNALFGSFLCILVSAILLKYSVFDPTNTKKQISLLSFFVTSYSTGVTYSLVDLTYMFFLFFVSVFSITLMRFLKEKRHSGNFTFGSSLNYLKAKDVVSLLGIVIISSVLDFIFFQLDVVSAKGIGNEEVVKWIHNVLRYLLRGFVPWLLFSVIIYKIVEVNYFKLTLRYTWRLFLAFAIINAFSYEFTGYIRPYVFNLILASCGADKRFMFESFMAIGLVAFYFVGYFSMMTNALKILSEKKPD